MISNFLPLADFNPGILALMIPITALLIPIVVVLTKHQQKMAEIMGGGSAVNELAREVQALRAEMQNLREIVHSQAIAMDDVAPLRRAAPMPPSHPEDIRQRLGQ